MKIVVYQCCDSKQRELGEKEIRLAWSDNSIDWDMPISMGAESTWAIADVITYNSLENQGIEAIELVYVFKGEKPDLSTWTYLAHKEAHPAQSLEIQISGIGSNFLGWVANIDGQSSEVGKYMLSYGLDENGIAHTRVEPWLNTAVSEFTTYETIEPFSRIDVTYHQIRAVYAQTVETELKTVSLGTQF